MTGRAIAAAAIGLLIGLQVIREAVVRTSAETDPASAARYWSGHPAVRLSASMVDIANATREGGPVPNSTFAQINAAAIGAPLAPEPFLVRGVQAQLSGDTALAKQAFLQARWRDGRSLPARYFLAEQYLRDRDASAGLREAVALSRLVPDGVSKLAPFVARYASNPGNQDQIKQAFRLEPDLETGALAILANDPGNANLVLGLASPDRVNGNSGWLPLLLEALIRDGQYARARSIWSKASGASLRPGELIYDPRFNLDQAPPPFNWSLNSSAVGLAERQPGGGLHIIYYGSEDGTLATQLLLLPPGRYEKTTRGNGAARAGSVSWALVCRLTNGPIASVPLDRATSGTWSFAVPQNCPAQRLDLAAHSSDSPEQVDFVVQSVELRRTPSNG